ncbi:MAG: bifunctional oligoribonuclease/PAP phosphatase NrnA [Deltaproteobacteria bacterium]|nr:bifunctional oligoribonuclease/PAP phosphatase NrnA [Deltaproteobacteria bacterium]
MDEIIQVIHKNQSYCISTHSNPDGDAIGSQLGFAHTLESLGKSVTLLNRDPTPRIYRFLAGADRILQTLGEKRSFDVYFIIDCADVSRVGNELTSHVTSRVTVNIDHHTTNRRFADINWVEPDASSSSEMIYRLARRLEAIISPEMAECLYTGIVMDTGSFRQGNTTPSALKIAGDLVELGANPGRVARELYEKRPFAQIQFLGMVLNTLEIRADGLLALVSVTRKMLQATGCTAEDIEGFVNYPCSIEGVEVGALLREEPFRGVKVSLRSRNLADVSRVASEFGGGGHQNAAGFYLDGTLEEVKNRVEEKIRFLLTDVHPIKMG